MQYLLYLFLSHLPDCREQKLLIEGKEEVCLVLPVKANQIKKGKQGNWMMMCRLAECEPNARMQTHDVQLSYLNPEDLQKSYDFGYHKRTAHMGRVYEHDRTPSKKIDRTNNASDIRLDGVIVLSDIDKSLIFRNSENNKRYLSNLTMRGLNGNDGFIYTGSLCVEDIDPKSILTDPNTGKKYIHTRLQKMSQLDTYFNTHELVVVKENGETNVIGLFKEWKREGYAPNPSPLPEIPNNNQNQKNVPDSIQGIKF